MENARAGAVVMAMLLAGCSSGDDAPPFKCALGELRGTWRLSYVEQDGTCGPIADETAVITGESSVPASCQQKALIISDDKCRMDLDFTCSANGVEQQWAGVTKHVAEGRLVSTMTAQATTASGASCRSTYQITWQRQ